MASPDVDNVGGFGLTSEQPQHGANHPFQFGVLTSQFAELALEGDTLLVEPLCDVEPHALSDAVDHFLAETVAEDIETCSHRSQSFVLVSSVSGSATAAI